MPSPKVDPKVAPIERVLLHEMALHPLPAFLWLGLYENATSDEVGRAYRQLSRTHHPDRGGSVLKWQITKKSLELLKGDERRSAYVRRGTTSNSSCRRSRAAPHSPASSASRGCSACAPPRTRKRRRRRGGKEVRLLRSAREERT